MPRIRPKRPIGPVKEQLFDDLLVNVKVVRIGRDPHYCDVQRRLPLAVLSVHVGSKLDQELHVHELLLDDRKVQRRGHEGIPHIDIVLVLLAEDEH